MSLSDQIFTVVIDDVDVVVADVDDDEVVRW